MSSRLARACYLTCLAALVAVYDAWPEAHVIVWAAIGLTSVSAVLAGVRAHRPARRLPWLLFVSALVAFTAGHMIYNAMVATGVEPPYPNWSDLLFLSIYPLFGGGLLLVLRARGGGRNRAALLDAAVPTVSVGLLSWVFLIVPYARTAGMDGLEKAVSVAYPLGGVLALAILLRLFIFPGTKPLSARWLAIAVVGLLAADVVQSLGRLDSTLSLDRPIGLGWIIFYAAVGCASIHPSMRDLTDRQTSAATSAGGHRLALLTAASLIAPAVLLEEHLRGGGVIDAPVIAAGSALMFLLVMARVGGLLADQRQVNARERALREASAGLASAAGTEDILGTVRTAVAAIMPDDAPYQLRIGEPRPEPPGEEPPGAEPAVDVGRPGEDTGAYAWELTVTMAVPGGGVPIRLAAAEPALWAVRPAVQALAAQVALVVERIELAREVSRRDGEAYFRTLIQSASDVILIVDDADRVEYASPSAATVFGYDDVTGFPLSRLVADTHHEELDDALLHARAGRGEADGVDLTAVCADRRLLQVEMGIRDLRAEPTVRGLVVTVRDVTERRRLENDLAHQAFHDSLTGLANRMLFRNRLEVEYARAELGGASLGVLFVDLDDFKEVNDTLGHAIGDQLLVRVARRIEQAVGAGNTAARMGGDEFAILVEQGDADAAPAIAARIVDALSVPVELSDGLGGTHVVSAAASVGVATNEEAKSPTELLRHADLALYLAKGAGKGGWQRYRSDLHDAMVERLALRTSLTEAVEARQFVLQYQPIVDVRTGIPMGVEALVRWQHPERGLLGPYHFIELAEENGAIVGIGEWVLRESLRQFAEWRSTGEKAALRYISVNVSARQFRQPGFVAKVREALADAAARPEWLLLEITESLVLRDADQVWADLEELRALGVRIAIDDFGTGYSSLSYLRQLPVDVLKIDKSFIDDILASKQQRALVNAIVMLARNLELTVVAEGIEDAGQRAMLGRMGCPLGQGYLFSKPVWPSEVPAMAGTVLTASETATATATGSETGSDAATEEATMT